MTDLEKFQEQRIAALEKLISMQTDLIDEQAKVIDEMQFKFADAKARYNMLVRNITVIDEIIEQPLKN